MGVIPQFGAVQGILDHPGVHLGGIPGLYLLFKDFKPSRSSWLRAAIGDRAGPRGLTPTRDTKPAAGMPLGIPAAPVAFHRNGSERTSTCVHRRDHARAEGPDHSAVRAQHLLAAAPCACTGSAVAGPASRGRRPASGFGTMRLKTLGRRSGEARAAIIGYYEDGPNLVTLAMNGWGRAEPAWWLNLQANPDATVDLAGGRRAVRARAARGRRTAAVPRSATTPAGARTSMPPRPSGRRPPGGRVRAARRRAEAFTTVVIAPTRSIDADRPRRLALRHLWLIPGLGIALFAQRAIHDPAGRPGPAPRVRDRAPPHGSRRVRPAPRSGPAGPPRRAALSTPCTSRSCRWRCSAWPPPAPPPFWLVGALAWFSHIVVDWGFDNGLRTADGYLRAPWSLGADAPGRVGFDGAGSTKAPRLPTASSVAARLAILSDASRLAEQPALGAPALRPHCLGRPWFARSRPSAQAPRVGSASPSGPSAEPVADEPGPARCAGLRGGPLGRPRASTGCPHVCQASAKAECGGSATPRLLAPRCAIR